MPNTKHYALNAKPQLTHSGKGDGAGAAEDVRERGPAAQTVPDPGNDPGSRERMTQAHVNE